MAKPRTVILMMHPAEADFFLDLVASHLPHADIFSLSSLNHLEDVSFSSEEPRLLLSFLNPVIVPQTMLDCMAAAYNLHPGPPDRPGFRPMEFAWYEGAQDYAVTLHEMTAKVDDGPILAVRPVSMDNLASLDDFEQRCYVQSVELVKDNLATMLKLGKKRSPSDHHWSGQKTTKRQYDQMLTAHNAD
ncbi:MAG: formyltransferase family protein [Cohaesibacter sp.]|jgi:methionyl-tRNA formyltransferase|nr:formyltransferase family protein [Cohaesibacter sp.]